MDYAPPPPSCDVTECPKVAVVWIVGEAGELWLCEQHAEPHDPTPAASGSEEDA